MRAVRRTPNEQYGDRTKNFADGKHCLLQRQARLARARQRLARVILYGIVCAIRNPKLCVL